MPELYEPKIVAFFCNWCTYLAADLAGTSRIKYAPNARVIRVMCSGRVDPQFVLEAFAQGGGAVVITPFTAYMDANGIFRGDGFAANLKGLTGGLMRTIRWMGSAETSGRKCPEAAWRGGGMTGTSPVGLEGYCEFLEVGPEAELIATFKSEQGILDGRPAATRRKLGRGSVVKLAFWPGDDSFLRLVRQMIPDGSGFLTTPLPAGVLAVPHTDNSMFIVNTTGGEMAIELSKAASDRLSETHMSGRTLLKPFQVVWLE